MVEGPLSENTPLPLETFSLACIPMQGVDPPHSSALPGLGTSVWQPPPFSCTRHSQL